MPTKMAILNIRNLPDDIHSRLRVRAAQNGRSMEAEARAILTAACGTAPVSEDPRALQSWVDSLYGGKKPQNAVDDLIAERRLEGRSE